MRDASWVEARAGTMMSSVPVICRRQTKQGRRVQVTQGQAGSPSRGSTSATQRRPGGGRYGPSPGGAAAAAQRRCRTSSTGVVVCASARQADQSQGRMARQMPGAAERGCIDSEQACAAARLARACSPAAASSQATLGPNATPTEWPSTTQRPLALGEAQVDVGLGLVLRHAPFVSDPKAGAPQAGRHGEVPVQGHAA